MSLSGHHLSLSALIILLVLQNCLQICESKTSDTLDDSSDLTYSDTNHGPQTAGAHQQIVYIDHGGGAISQIRRTSFYPNPSLPSVPSLPMRPHIQHYPNSIYENNLGDDPYANFPEDIPRIVDRRSGPNTDHNLGIRTQPPIPFVPQSAPQPVPPQPIHPHLQPLPPAFQTPDLHRITRFQPLPQPLPQPPTVQQLPPQPIPQVFPHSFPQHLTQPLTNPNPQHIFHSNPPLPVHQTLPQVIPHSVAQPIALPPETHRFSQPFRHPLDDIEDERFLINNEIERIPKPSNQIKPARRDPPTTPAPPPPPPPIQEDPPLTFFDFNSPELFGGIDAPFGGLDPFGGPQNNGLFQRRRLTSNPIGQPDVNQNTINYPPFPYYKGEDSLSSKVWPKIFKFSDGRSNLYDFEKQKKQNKIKFNSKETYFDHISRDSFLILHGGTYAQ